MNDHRVAPHWQEELLPADAWRRPDAHWDVEAMLDLLASLSPDAACDRRGPALIPHIVPAAALREVAAVHVDERGSLTRPADVAVDDVAVDDVAVDTDLLAWVIECVWRTSSGLRTLREGYTIVRVRAEVVGAMAHLCIPLRPGGREQTVIACSLTASSDEEVVRLASRLTILTSIVPSASATYAREGTTPGSSPLRPDALSGRQRAILAGMAEGLTNRQIAARICFSESTVRLESMAIYRYFGVHSRSGAVAAAREAGVIHDGTLSVGA